MKRLLIVNADDCNLTPGVTAAILDCHDHGILTSTTFMANLPIKSADVRALRSRKQLGVGIHLNITMGRPVSKPARIPSLLDPRGNFRRDWKDAANAVGARHAVPLPIFRDVITEYNAQIDLFKKAFGRLPTHLDTHHHLHAHPFFLKALLQVAKKYKLSIRQPVIASPAGAKQSGFRKKQIASAQSSRLAMTRTTDYFFGDLDAEKYWRGPALSKLLARLPAGTSEIMCHPGRVDRDLKQVSSFLKGRAAEWKLFRAPALRRKVRDAGIQLIHFGMV